MSRNYLLTFLCLIVLVNIAAAQSGTYQKRDKNGALCNIAITRSGHKLTLPYLHGGVPLRVLMEILAVPG